MRKEISEKIEFPQEVEVEVSEDEIKFKKGNDEISRKYHGFSVKKEGNSLLMYHKKATKNEKKLINTFIAHVNNALQGLDKKFVYKLQICAIHFPMSITVDKAKNELMIKNFLGGVKPRFAKIVKSVDVKVDKEIITVEGHDKEKTGQTAANIERATRITNRDRRVFQDGIYITQKPE